MKNKRWILTAMLALGGFAPLIAQQTDYVFLGTRNDQNENFRGWIPGMVAPAPFSAPGVGGWSFPDAEGTIVARKVGSNIRVYTVFGSVLQIQDYDSLALLKSLGPPLSSNSIVTVNDGQTLAVNRQGTMAYVGETLGGPAFQVIEEFDVSIPTNIKLTRTFNVPIRQQFQYAGGIQMGLSPDGNWLIVIMNGAFGCAGGAGCGIEILDVQKGAFTATQFVPPPPASGHLQDRISFYPAPAFEPTIGNLAYFVVYEADNSGSTPSGGKIGTLDFSSSGCTPNTGVCSPTYKTIDFSLLLDAGGAALPFDAVNDRAYFAVASAVTRKMQKILVLPQASNPFGQTPFLTPPGNNPARSVDVLFN